MSYHPADSQSTHEPLDGAQSKWVPTRPMRRRICVAGSGAIGGTLAVRLAAAGHDVSVIARGAHLDAIRQGGLRLVEPDAASPIKVAVKASADVDFGVQDMVFVSVKAHGLAQMLAMLAPLFDERTIVVPTVNGVPWWYFQGHVPARFKGMAVRSVDPDGALLRAVPSAQVIGCVVYMASHIIEPGVVAAGGANRLVLGELDDQPSERLIALCALLTEAGIGAVAAPRIRDALWAKLMANTATNPLSVVANASLGELHASSGLANTIRTVMEEVQAVARAYGAEPDTGIDRLIEGGRKLGAFRTSMLQDFEKGQTLELAAIGDAVVELAAQAGIAIPVTREIIAIARFLEAQRGRHADSAEPTAIQINVGRTDQETTA